MTHKQLVVFSDKNHIIFDFEEIDICSIHFPFFGVRQNFRTVNDVFPQVHKGENGLKNPYLKFRDAVGFEKL